MSNSDNSESSQFVDSSSEDGNSDDHKQTSAGTSRRKLHYLKATAVQIIRSNEMANITVSSETSPTSSYDVNEKADEPQCGLNVSRLKDINGMNQVGREI